MDHFLAAFRCLPNLRQPIVDDVVDDVVPLDLDAPLQMHMEIGSVLPDLPETRRGRGASASAPEIGSVLPDLPETRRGRGAQPAQQKKGRGSRKRKAATAGIDEPEKPKESKGPFFMKFVQECRRSTAQLRRKQSHPTESQRFHR